MQVIARRRQPGSLAFVQQTIPFVLSHAAQAFRLQFIQPDHILVLNEIRKFRRTELHKRVIRR
jgi:hypothetical protein